VRRFSWSGKLSASEQRRSNRGAVISAPTIDKSDRFIAILHASTPDC